MMYIRISGWPHAVLEVYTASRKPDNVTETPGDASSDHRERRACVYRYVLSPRFTRLSFGWR